MRNWKRRGWRTADNKPVKNEDLWRDLDEAAVPPQVAWHWVKGHADDPDQHPRRRTRRRGDAAVQEAKGGEPAV